MTLFLAFKTYFYCVYLQHAKSICLKLEFDMEDEISDEIYGDLGDFEFGEKLNEVHNES